MASTNGLTLTDIANHLAKQEPAVLTAENRGHAAVAMLLREGVQSPEALFIIRSKDERDPWSGNIGFPGGRLNTATESPRQAAERETLEELSIDLDQALYLGRLNDLYGATLPVLVSCFVYQITEPISMRLNHEVSTTFWCPLAKLLQPQLHRQSSFFYRGKERTHPAVVLLAPDQPLLWGITYRLLRCFFNTCHIEFGSPEPKEATLF